jgi:hypothetical protein
MPAFTTLGAVDRDEDLLAALARLAEAGPGWITASGYVTDVELRLPSPEGFALRQLKGSYALIHLAGVSTGPFFVMLTRGNGDGVEAWGGELVRARSLGVHVAAHPGRLATPAPDAESASASRTSEGAASTPLEVPVAARPAAPATLPKPAWAMAAAASARSNAFAPGDAEDPELPEVGDLVDHFAFGRCEVVGSDGDRLKLRDVKPPGRVREVSVEMLRVMAPTQIDGRRVFLLARRIPS